MVEYKQLLFMERVLFVYDITKAKAGRAQRIRMSSQQWLLEADVACLGGHILSLMEVARNDDSLILFPSETIVLVRQRFIEGNLGT